MNSQPKVVAIVQARMGSSRLPGKVLKKVLDKPLIDILLKRLSMANEINEMVVATSKSKNNKELINFLHSNGYEYFVGSENNVLNRYKEAANKYEADIIVRITGDCPLIDFNLVDECIRKYKVLNVDYLSNVHPPTYPDGLDIEIFNKNILLDASINAKSDFDKEHVTSYMANNKKYKSYNHMNTKDESHNRWTVDEQKDLNLIIEIFNHFAPNIFFSWKDVMRLKSIKPKIFNINKNIKRNEGSINV